MVKFLQFCIALGLVSCLWSAEVKAKKEQKKGGYWLDRGCAAEMKLDKKMRKCLPKGVKEKSLPVVAFDLDGDKVADYFLVCAGKEGDSYVIFDGGKKKCIGEFIASRVYIEHRRFNDMPVIYVYLIKANGSVQYVCYIYDNKKYVKVSSSYLLGEILEKLDAKLAKYVRIGPVKIEDESNE